MYEIFENIENKKEFAYMLGYIWADGTVNRNKYVVLEIVKDDADDIEHIIKKIFSYKRSERKRNGRKPQSTFFINDKEFAEFLIENGKYPNTTETHGKILNWIGEDYRIYFLRGLIDGDGCFYSGPANKKWKNNTIHFTICSSYNQDWKGLIDYCNEFNIKLNPMQKIRKNGSKWSFVRLSNFFEIESLINILYYEKDEIWLKRKFDKIMFAINEHKKNTKLSAERRKKYSIRYSDGTEVVINNLKKFAKDNGFCYECLNKAANNSGKYKNINIRKL